ncbi:glucose PTS transporter subunit IIA [Mycoplasmopsis gallopavonis]|uniref:PTS system, glucose/glucosamine/beta-glucoside-specific, IICBA component n=1 Tax=Mycoplasmopsis gallopavonis TaxID=76629 RepID=A0A449AZ54_9BACT|nr:glucose PTS transporter subunit IIA [Mycoplasmopsis gallopavonis]RIV16389.1 PTS sugar transporter subunit IIABC [Mycoplasmopsis gallopavonis]VEU72767.1 PTS system, glucose/glucosamine/beta-glucoside-specific, IICBA component [Mycoplasmopsis gallopavonis]
MFSLFKGKVFSSQKEKSKNNSGSGKVRKVLSKISGAFMLPISVMAIAGMFLGIGAAINSNSSSEGLKIFGSFITNLGDPIFFLLPLLFAIAFVIAFTDEAGVAVFATVIGYTVFLAIQSVFIWDKSTSHLTTTNVYDIVLDKNNIANEFGNVVVNNQKLAVAYDQVGTPTYYLLSNEASLQDHIILVQVKKVNDVISFADSKGKALNLALNAQNVLVQTKVNPGYTVLFSGLGRNPESLYKLVGSSLGIKSLQTSVFGGIIVGLVVQWIYRRFHTIQLPSAISFFGGKRFVALVTIPLMAILAFVFLIFWPWVGVALNAAGKGLGQLKYGDSFVFGWIERSLIPFGLHQVFYSPLWYTPVGGDVESALNSYLASKEGLAAVAKLTDQQAADLESFKTFVAENAARLQGDSTISLNIIKWDKNQVFGKPVFDFLAQDLGIRVGRFMDGKFSIMMFGLPGAAVAMVLAAPKENRKVTLGTVLPAAATSFLIGVTEPIEFTFLFLSPVLFWVFHAGLAAVSFLLANVLGVHIPMAFSGGALDMVIYGMVNVQKGTNFYWPFVVGVPYFFIYLGLFYWFIRWKDLETPGRGGNTKLFTKADYNASKNDASTTTSDLGNVDKKALDIVVAYGGIDNITAFNNCASRLRYDVKDASLVSESKLKAAGAFGVKYEGQHHVQAIFGPAAEQLNAKIKSQREAIREYLAKNPQFTEADVIEATQKAFNDQTEELINPVKLQTVARGKIMNLSELNDGAFSTGALGQGFAVKFASDKEGNVYSPVDGQVDLVFGTKHAYGISTKEGVKLLIHIGIDTVKLNGEGFTSLVQTGDHVKAGQNIAKVDLELLASKNIQSDVICVVLQEGSHKDFSFTNEELEAQTTTTLVGEVR